MRLQLREHRKVRLRGIVHHHCSAAANSQPFAVGRQRNRQDRLIGRRQRGEFHRCGIGLILCQRLRIPNEPTLDPVAEDLDLRVRELLLRRHVRVGVSQKRPGEPAGIRLAWHDDHALVIAFKQSLARRQNQSAFFLFLVVARKTLCSQHLHRFA